METNEVTESTMNGASMHPTMTIEEWMAQGKSMLGDMMKRRKALVAELASLDANIKAIQGHAVAGAVTRSTSENAGVTERILVALGESPGLRVSEIAEVVDIDRATVSNRLSQLVRGGRVKAAGARKFRRYSLKAKK